MTRARGAPAPPDASRELERVDRMRRSRNQLVYEGEEVGEAERVQAVADAQALLDLVDRFLQESR